jgi:hypothetical protein
MSRHFMKLKMGNGGKRRKTAVQCRAIEQDPCKPWSAVAEDTSGYIAYISIAIIPTTVYFHASKTWGYSGKLVKKKVESLPPTANNVDSIPSFDMWDDEAADRGEINEGSITRGVISFLVYANEYIQS